MFLLLVMNLMLLAPLMLHAKRQSHVLSHCEMNVYQLRLVMAGLLFLP